jgi:hypothetical protein
VKEGSARQGNIAVNERKPNYTVLHYVTTCYTMTVGPAAEAWFEAQFIRGIIGNSFVEDGNVG